jgi:hypothetical protein
MMFSILQYTIGGMWAASVSTLSITNLGVAFGMGKALLDVVLAQRVDHEGKAPDVAETCRWGAAGAA